MTARLRLVALLAILAAPVAGLAQEAELPISAARIRRGLEQAPPRLEPPPVEDIRTLPLPTYRVEIFSPFIPMDPFVSIIIPPWQPVPYGGVINKEMMDLMTPPLSRPYAGLSAGELLTATAQSLVTAGVIEMAKTGIRALAKDRRKRKEEAIRREIAEELAAVITRAEQAKAAAGVRQPR